ncbi:MAG TPA: ABC transporter permease [Trebonia sp.]|jgi:ribose/xylose/arabinose/galactoside ABC-type transport system permease subunit
MTADTDQAAHAPGPARIAGLRRDGALASLSRDIYVDLALVGALVLLLIVFGIASGGREFLETNLVSILDSGSILGVIAVGEVIVMISGNLDISVGSGAGLVTATMAVVITHFPGNLALGLVIAVATGLAAGLVNGVAVAYARVNSVIATLATYSAYLGIALLVTNGQEVAVNSDALGTLGTGKAGPIPYLVIVLVVVTVLAMFGMRHSLGGHRMYAVGGSDQASRLAGLKVQRYMLAAFLLSGLCVAIGGVMLAGQTGTAQPTEGSVGLELTAITAVLLGGTGLTGGTGTVLGAVLGVLVLSTLDNGLLLLGVPAFWQQVATGVVLMIAVLLQDVSGHRSRIRTLRAARQRARRAAGAAR